MVISRGLLIPPTSTLYGMDQAMPDQIRLKRKVSLSELVEWLETVQLPHGLQLPLASVVHMVGQWDKRNQTNWLIFEIVTRSVDSFI